MDQQRAGRMENVTTGICEGRKTRSRVEAAVARGDDSLGLDLETGPRVLSPNSGEQTIPIPAAQRDRNARAERHLEVAMGGGPDLMNTVRIDDNRTMNSDE